MLWLSCAALLALLLGTVLRAALLAVANALEVERATNDVVAHTRKVRYAATTHENYSVFLQVVTFTANVSPDFLAIGKAHARNFTQG
jgi:hypothetical protein